MPPETSSLTIEHQHRAAQQLATFRIELEGAAETRDWALVESLNNDITRIAQAFPKERRQPCLTEEMTLMKASYERVFSDSRRRKQTLRQELDELRGKRVALDGYKKTLAAGNRELRESP